MENSTAKLCMDHLVHLGFFPHLIGQKWRDNFKKNPIGTCQGCGNKIRVTNPISKQLGMKYYSKKHLPEIHWIFNFSLDVNNPDAVNQCKAYIETLSNSKKKDHMFPCCYKCWNIAVMVSGDYFTDSVDTYYKTYQQENPEYINWNTVNFESIQDEQHRQAKIMFNYEYIATWCNQVGLCCETTDGLKYCGKGVGKCIHTNAEMMEQHQHKLLLKQQQKLQEQQVQAANVLNVSVNHNDSVMVD
jgi:hypothetical protein